MKTMRLVALASAVSVVMAVAACTGDGGGGGNGSGGGPRPAWNDFGVVPVPEGVPTPAGPIFLAEFSSPDGTPTLSTGKCLGFTLVANEPGLYFGSSTKVSAGPHANLPTLLVDGTHLRVGDPSTGFRCFYTPLFGETGVWDVQVDVDGVVYEIPGAITIVPTKLLEVGRVEQEYVWSLEKVLDPEANQFEVPYDVDVYRVDFFQAEEHHSFAHTEFFPTGPTALLPIMEFRYASDPGVLTARGGYGLIFPKRGANYVVVKDVLGQGGPGATYELQFITQMAGGGPTSERCFTAPLITPRTYYLDYDSLTNDFDPQGACRDSVYNIPINAPGKDAVWRVKVPAGKQLRVSSYDNHIDNTMYLLPVSVLGVGTNGCPAQPTTCAAAAGRFGGGNTDTLIYDNVSAVEEEFFLIHDSATVMTIDVGSFLFDVAIWD